MSVPQESLQDILSGKEPAEIVETPAPTGDAVEVTETAKAAAAPPAAKQEKQETDDKPSRARDESGKFTKAEETKPEVEAKPDKPRPDVAAIIDERRKRQAAEARLRELEGKSAQAKPSVLEDEEGAFKARLEEHTRPLREMLYQQSVESAKHIHGEKFQEAAEAFAEAVEQNEGLLIGLRNAPNPGQYIFENGLFARDFAKYGNSYLALREGISKETGSQSAEMSARIKALEAENAALKQQKADLEALPRSLNSRPSGAQPQAGSEDPEDIKTIARFGNQKH